MSAQHGTRARYLAGCRCRPCTDGAVAAVKEYKHRVKYEGKVIIPADRARRHLQFLRESGIDANAASRACGLSRHLVQRIASGKQPRIYRRTEDAILSVSTSGLTHVKRVPGDKARALIDELGRAGITQCDIAAMLQYKNSKCLQLARRKYVSRRSWERLTTIYRYYASRGIVPASLLEEVAS